jgi:hypothetical protein
VFTPTFEKRTSDMSCCVPCSNPGCHRTVCDVTSFGIIAGWGMGVLLPGSQKHQ